MAKTVKINGFSGINNVKEPWELAIDPETGIADATAISNYDINNSHKLVPRPGRTAIDGSLPIESPSEPLNGTVYGQLNGNLVSTQDFVNYSVLLYGIGNYPISWAQAEDLLVWTNGGMIQFIFNGATYPFPVPNDSFKSQLPPSQLIAYYLGCLYLAVNDTVWQSEPLADSPFIDNNPQNGGSCRVFGSTVAMMLPVGDGIFFSDTTALWWSPGGNLQEMTKIKIDDCHAIPGVFCRSRGPAIGYEGLKGIIWYVGTNKGLILIGDGGVFYPITEKRYNMPEATNGTMAFTQRNGLNQVIAILNQ